MSNEETKRLIELAVPQIIKMILAETDKRYSKVMVQGAPSDDPPPQVFPLWIDSKKIHQNGFLKTVEAIEKKIVESFGMKNGSEFSNVVVDVMQAKKENSALLRNSGYVVNEGSNAEYFKREKPMTEYEAMVTRLFKPMENNGHQAHHATTGICGEVAELLAATDRTNIIEELGDLLFYRVALSQRLSQRPGGIEETKEVIESRYYRPDTGSVLINLVIIAGNMLDLTKKAWIYSDSPKGDLKEYEIWQQLALFDLNFTYYLGLLNLGMGDIEKANMTKLGQRYSSGSYSNEQALARADKK